MLVANGLSLLFKGNGINGKNLQLVVGKYTEQNRVLNSSMQEYSNIIITRLMIMSFMLMTYPWRKAYRMDKVVQIVAAVNYPAE